LIAEDSSDIAFLLPVLQAQLERIGWDAQFASEQIYVPEITSVRSAESVAATAAGLLEFSDLVFVHHDLREAAKIDRLRERARAGNRVVGIIPVRETEAWVLAAACAASRVAEFDAKPPEKGFKWVERISDPKAELRRRYRGKRSAEEFFTLIAERADLAKLAEVPAYQSFLQDLTKALKELSFL
jgi:hypothetical protein